MLKKINLSTYIIVLLLLILPINVLAKNEINAIFESKSTGTYENIELKTIFDNNYIANIDKKTYVISKCNSPYYIPIEYNEEIENHFYNEEYVFADDYYFTRECENDASINFMSQINLQNNIKLYDNNYNLIVSKSFDGYVYKHC